MRVAIVGTGAIARVHARLARDLGGDVVAACGRTFESAQAFGAGQPYTDVEAMLREQSPDVVHVCSPNHLHAEHTVAAFAAGAHVLCEKPMATSVAECRRMIEAAERAGRVGAIAYTYRGYPLVELLRRKVAAGDFGTLRRFGGCYLSQDVMAADKYVWLFTPGTTGRSYALMDLGVHWLNLVEHVSGQRIAEITAQFSTFQPTRLWRGGIGEGPRPPGREVADGGVAVDIAVEEQADLLVRLSGGAAGCVTVSGVAPGHPNTIILSADGSEAGFDWNQEAPNTFVERRPDGNTIRQRAPDDLPADVKSMTMLPAGQPEGYLDAFRTVIAQSWAAMRGEASAFPTFAEGLRGIELIEAAARSAAERRPVATDPLSPSGGNR